MSVGLGFVLRACLATPSHAQKATSGTRYRHGSRGDLVKLPLRYLVPDVAAEDPPAVAGNLLLQPEHGAL